ncbi:hypothetical protein [Pseudonocardia acaciae]|uniref:hypothetical protein n=1 Tax=Pseudonocardia acaciae TaxID=551276 RepID=UPI00068878D8|nr:hypothetical protein [Pseudonocardia acaciae]
MSAPTAERTRAGRSSARSTGQPGPRRSAGLPTPRDADGAIGRAYAKRAGRARRLATTPGAVAPSRSRFVLMVMGLLGVGLVASLWLSTTAAADSYRLDAARQATQGLAERGEALRTEIAAMESAPALAKAAQQMGMVPSTDVARLVSMPDGSVQVVGTPKAATAAAPPPMLAPPAPPAPALPNASGSGQATAPQAVTPAPAQRPVQQQPVQQQPVQQPVQQQPAEQLDQRLPEEQLTAPAPTRQGPAPRAASGGTGQ